MFTSLYVRLLRQLHVVVTYYSVIHVNVFMIEEKRDTEIELTNERAASITPEQGLVVSPPPPKSVELITSVEVSSYCRSVHTYNGVTYAGCSGGVDRIDENNKITKSFISINGRYVFSISVHNGQMYTFSSDSTVRVYDLQGRFITSWTHADKLRWTNQLTIVNNQIAIPDRVNNTLLFYSLNGEVVNTLPSPLSVDDPIRVSVADNNSIIISRSYSSLVYKVDTSSGDIIWQCKEVTGPRGVTCYRDEFLLVADSAKPTTLCVLSVHTGSLLCRIHL